MSELKARGVDDVYIEYYNTGKHELAQVYLKSEADKVIAEKDGRIDLYKRGFEESDRINAHIYKELRHNKHKRCLAMAKWCESECRHYEDLNNRKVLVDHVRWSLLKDWHKRWLELAEKFKGDNHNAG